MRDERVTVEKEPFDYEHIAVPSVNVPAIHSIMKLTEKQKTESCHSYKIIEINQFLHCRTQPEKLEQFPETPFLYC